MAMRSDASEYGRLLDLVEDWLAGATAPARGLFLERVLYDGDAI